MKPLWLTSPREGPASCLASGNGGRCKLKAKGSSSVLHEAQATVLTSPWAPLAEMLLWNMQTSPQVQARGGSAAVPHRTLSRTVREAAAGTSGTQRTQKWHRLHGQKHFRIFNMHIALELHTHTSIHAQLHVIHMYWCTYRHAWW